MQRVEITYPEWWVSEGPRVLTVEDGIPVLGPADPNGYKCPHCGAMVAKKRHLFGFHKYLDLPSGGIGNGWFETIHCVCDRIYISWNGDL